MAEIQLTISGDVADAVTLLSMTRSDTGGAVVFGDGVFTDAGAGVWTYDFTEPVGDVTYAYTFRITWPDATFTDGNGSLWVSSVVGWAGYYTSVDALEKKIDVTTVDHLFDLNGDQVRDNGADRAAGEDAEAELHEHAAGGKGLLPFTFHATPAGVIGASIVKGWATGLYAFHAAEKRGLQGVELEKWKALHDRIIASIDAYRGGVELPGVVEETADDNIVNAPSVARADGTAVDATDLAWARRRERLVNADGGWYYPYG